VLCADGQALVLALHDSTHQLTVIKTRIGELPGRVKSPFLALCLYRDYSGLFTTEARLAGRRTGPTRPGARPGPAVADLDEEDELLYGSSEAQVRLGL
jgi:cleavage and polyadenylation specificity factor subunit 1